jgi:hypothetical protein
MNGIIQIDAALHPIRYGKEGVIRVGGDDPTADPIPKVYFG